MGGKKSLASQANFNIKKKEGKKRQEASVSQLPLQREILGSAPINNI